MLIEAATVLMLSGPVPESGISHDVLADNDLRRVNTSWLFRSMVAQSGESMSDAAPEIIAEVFPAQALQPAIHGQGIADARAPVVISKPQKAVADNRSASQRIMIQRLEFKKAKLIDVMRTISELSNTNIVPTAEAADKEVTIYLRDISVHDAVDTICRSVGVWYRQDKSSKAYRVMTAEQYRNDVIVYREDSTQIFNLLHPNPVVVATAIRDIYPNRVQLSLGVEDTTGFGGIGGGIGGGAGGFGGTGGIGGTAGRGVGNTGMNTATRTRTSLGTGGNYNRRVGGAGARGVNIASERVFDEELTPEQLSRLDAAIAQSGDDGVISSEALQGISRTEQPIYVTLNREHNLIIVRTSDSAAMAEMERLIKEMDKPTPQVLLELKVLELTSGNSFRQTFSITGTSGDGNESLGLGNFPVEGGTLVYNYINSVISARLELLERNNHINTLSSPILLASNNKPSQVFVGEERVIVTGVDVAPATAVNGVVVSSVAVPVTEVRNIGNTLQILPKINADNTVTLMVQQDSSSVNVGGGSLPVLIGNNVQNFSIDTVNTSNIQGTVVAKDGLTVAIGGLISHRDSENVQKVPFIGDIPLVGQLFQRKEQIKSKSELVLLITPRIITNPADAQDVSDETMDEVSIQGW